MENEEDDEIKIAIIAESYNTTAEFQKQDDSN
jgi:hypothetical protein